MPWTHKVHVHRDIAPNRPEAEEFALRLFAAQWAFQVSPKAVIRVILIVLDGQNWEVTLEVDELED